MLRTGDTDRLTLPAVARVAEVSHATAYKHFVDDDALLLAVIDAHRERTSSTLYEEDVSPDELYRVPLRVFPLLDADREIAVIAAHSRAVSRVRKPGRQRVKASLMARLAPLARGLHPDELEAVAGAIQVLALPRVWYLLEEHWGLRPDQAARAAAWATRALVEALRRDPKAFRSIPAPEMPKATLPAARPSAGHSVKRKAPR